MGNGGNSQNFRDYFNDERSLREFVGAMADFNHRFCDSMAAGTDFTLKLEVHGNCGELLHARVNDDSFRRPPAVEREVERKRQDKIRVPPGRTGPG